MASRRFWPALLPGFLLAQSSGVLSLAPVEKLAARRGATVDAKMAFILQPGYHTNSHTPSEDYLIPLKLTWDKGPLEVVEVVYPKPHFEKYSFSEKPLSVFTGNFHIVTRFKVAAGTPSGPNMMSGKLRYQACNDKACLPPKNLEVKLPVVIQ